MRRMILGGQFGGLGRVVDDTLEPNLSRFSGRFLPEGS